MLYALSSLPSAKSSKGDTITAMGA